MPLPENIQWLLHDAGIPWAEVEETHRDKQAMNQLLDVGKADHCMTCGNRLGENTTVLFSNGGIQSVYCSGICMTDQMLIGWLQGHLEDLYSAIQLRQLNEDGREVGDIPEVEDDSEGDES